MNLTQNLSLKVPSKSKLYDYSRKNIKNVPKDIIFLCYIISLITYGKSSENHIHTSSSMRRIMYVQIRRDSNFNLQSKILEALTAEAADPHPSFSAHSDQSSSRTHLHQILKRILRTREVSCRYNSLKHKSFQH